MMMIWTRRRRPPLGRRILRSLLIVGAAAGAAASVRVVAVWADATPVPRAAITRADAKYLEIMSPSSSFMMRR